MGPRTTAVGQVEQLETKWRRAFGWAQLSIDVVELGPRALRLDGEVVLGRSISNIVANVRQALPGVEITSGLVEAPPGAWYSWDGSLSIWRTAAGEGSLATELAPDDGPVERRAEFRGMALVRARDGTAGWVRSTRLRAEVNPPQAWGALDPDFEALEASARRFVGTPYRLGGTSGAGIDCSGLVQRAARACCEIPMPRHSADQRRLGEFGEAGAPRLAFVWTDEEAPCHVGVVVGPGPDSPVVHASRSRSVVVEDSRERFFRAARRVEFLSTAALREYWRAMAGARRVPESVLGGPRV